MIKDKNGKMVNRSRKGGKNTRKNYTKKVLMTWISMNVWSLNLKPDILEHEVKWALGSITTNKVSGREEFQLSYFKS